MADLSYEVKKNVLGQYAVHYVCPKCGEGLKSVISDAGNSDTCPVCHTQFVVPGSNERVTIEREQEAAKQRKREATEKRNQEREQRKRERRDRQRQCYEKELETEVAPDIHYSFPFPRYSSKSREKQQKSEQKTTRNCPFCEEKILAAAVKCKHCGEFLDGRKQTRPSQTKKTGDSSSWASILLLVLIGFCCFGVFNTQNDSDTSPNTREVQTREERIEEGFSAWDGSHRGLTQLIKQSMDDPESYEHVETVYWDLDKKGHLIVRTTFRGKNAFGGVVKNWVKAKCDLDGNVIEVLEWGP